MFILTLKQYIRISSEEGSSIYQSSKVSNNSTQTAGLRFPTRPIVLIQISCKLFSSECRNFKIFSNSGKQISAVPLLQCCEQNKHTNYYC